MLPGGREIFPFTGSEIVDPENLMAGGEQLVRGVAPDETCRSGDEYACHLIVPETTTDPGPVTGVDLKVQVFQIKRVAGAGVEGLKDFLL